jgi:hypothetical protein
MVSRVAARSTWQGPKILQVWVRVARASKDSLRRMRTQATHFTRATPILMQAAAQIPNTLCQKQEMRHQACVIATASPVLVTAFFLCPCTSEPNCDDN